MNSYTFRRGDTNAIGVELFTYLFVSNGKTITLATKKSASEEDVMTPGESIVVPPPVVSPAPEPDQSTDNQPSGTDYVVNANTGKFHYPSCSSVKK